MIEYDLHIHHELCGHAKGMTTEAILDAAGHQQLKVIAISDHIFSPQSIPRLEQIRREVNSLPHPCKVIVGAEVDVDGEHTDGRLVSEDFEQFDYILAGFHYVPGVGNYPHGPEECTLRPEKMLAVWESSLMGVVSNAKIDTLAHPGRLAASAMDLDVFRKDVEAVFEMAAKESAKNSICWEINELSVMKVPDRYHHWWHEVYEIALDQGVKLVYGSDAHHPGAVGLQTFSLQLLEKLPDSCLAGPAQLGLL